MNKQYNFLGLLVAVLFLTGCSLTSLTDYLGLTIKDTDVTATDPTDPTVSDDNPINDLAAITLEVAAYVDEAEEATSFTFETGSTQVFTFNQVPGGSFNHDGEFKGTNADSLGKTWLKNNNLKSFFTASMEDGTNVSRVALFKDNDNNIYPYLNLFKDNDADENTDVWWVYTGNAQGYEHGSTDWSEKGTVKIALNYNDGKVGIEFSDIAKDYKQHNITWEKSSGEEHYATYTNDTDDVSGSINQAGAAKATQDLDGESGNKWVTYDATGFTTPTTGGTSGSAKKLYSGLGGYHKNSYGVTVWLAKPEIQ